MKHKARKEIWSYLLENVYWNLLVLWCYQNLLYCTVPGLNVEASLLLLNALVVAGICFGFLLTFRNRRNSLSIFIGAMYPVSFYYILSLWQMEWESITKVMGWTCVAAVCYVVLVGICYVRDRLLSRTRTGVWKCAFGCFMGVRTIVAFGMAVLLIGTCIGLLPMDTARQKETPTRSESDQTYRNQIIIQNIDALLLLQQDVWRELDLGQRLEVLQIVSEMECANWGIPQVKICALSMSEETLGAYEHGTQTVMLSLEHLAFDEPEDILDTLCHEVYHAYQHRLVDLYNSLNAPERELALFRDVSDYAYEFDHYISGSDEGQTFESYINQKCEADSYAYASQAVSFYFDIINSYIEWNGLGKATAEWAFDTVEGTNEDQRACTLDLFELYLDRIVN